MNSWSECAAKRESGELDEVYCHVQLQICKDDPFKTGSFQVACGDGFMDRCLRSRQERRDGWRIGKNGLDRK